MEGRFFNQVTDKIKFTNLTANTFYSIKANERKTKNKSAKYNTLSTQWTPRIRSLAVS